MTPITILRLAVHCPECGATPKLRTSNEWVEFLKKVKVDPERFVESYQCHIRSCNTTYDIQVKHFHFAA